MNDITMDNQQVTDTDLAWLAGIYDGEGWFSLRLRQDILSVNLSIGVVNTDTNIINKVDEILTWLGVSHSIAEKQHDKWKTRYDVTVKRFSSAIILIEAVLPYLVAKGGQAKLLHRFCTRRLHTGRMPYAEEELQIIQEYKTKYARTQEPQRLHA